MRTSETFNELAAALAKAQGAIENAEKDRENVFLKNRYMTLTAVWDAIRKPLSDNGLSIVQVTEADDGALMLLTRLMHSSGQYIEATYPVLGMDAKGVNAAQAAGSALTYARRYSLTSMIGVVADEDDDAASATGKQQPKAQAKPAPVQPVRTVTIERPAPSAQAAANDAAFNALPSASAERAGNGKTAQATKHSERPFKDQGSAVQWACRFPYYRQIDKSGVSHPDIPHAVGSLKKLCAELGCSDREVDCWADAWMDYVAIKAAATLEIAEPTHADLDAQAASEAPQF